MEMLDHDLQKFEAVGALPVPRAAQENFVEHEGARIWYSSFGSGKPVLMPHGGLGNSGNWGYQVPALTAAGYPSLQRRGDRVLAKYPLVK